MTRRHNSSSALYQAMACCLTAPSHYLNQCWFIISVVLWHSSKTNFLVSAKDSNSFNVCPKYKYTIVFTKANELLSVSKRGLWRRSSAREKVKPHQAPLVLQCLKNRGGDKMTDILYATFSHSFFWMKIAFWIEFHGSLFPRAQITICQHWFI